MSHAQMIIFFLNFQFFFLIGIIWKSFLITKYVYIDKIRGFTKLILLTSIINCLLSFSTSLFTDILPIPTIYTFQVLKTDILIFELLLYTILFFLITKSKLNKVIDRSVFVFWVIILTINILYFISICTFQITQQNSLHINYLNNVSIRPNYDIFFFLDNVFVPLIWIVISFRLLYIKYKIKI